MSSIVSKHADDEAEAFALQEDIERAERRAKKIHLIRDYVDSQIHVDSPDARLDDFIYLLTYKDVILTNKHLMPRPCKLINLAVSDDSNR